MLDGSHTSDRARAALLHEARVTGRLEHPNIVPIHVLGVDASDRPVMVMKRIEGASLRALLHDPAHPGWSPLDARYADRLEAQVAVLQGVCDALSYAHDKGVVHRDVKPENVMVGPFGEVYLLDEAAMADYYGTGDELHLSFNFRFLWAPFEPGELATRIRRTIDLLRERGAWPTWVLSNHDVPRHRQRYGGDEMLARMAAIMLLTLPGTPFMYQGEELGLLDAVIPPERVVDPGLRDGCRAPIPWDSSPLHGWVAEPWLPFAEEAGSRNVAAQLADDGSMLHFYRRLLALRRATPALHAGIDPVHFQLLDHSPDLLAWVRSSGSDRWFTYVNPSPRQHPAGSLRGATIVIATDPALEGTVVNSELPGRAAFVARRDGTM